MIYEFASNAKGDVFRRNKFGDLNQIKKWAKQAGYYECYSSIFGYDTPDVYNSPLYAGFYLDLDDAKDLDQPYQDLQTLIEILNQQNVPYNDYAVYFTGSKGFAVNFSAVSCGVAPDGDWPRVFRKLAEELNEMIPNKTIDFSVYERRRLWRMTNTINGKSALYKINLPVPTPPLKTILSMAKKPQPTPRHIAKPNPILQGWVRRARADLTKPVNRRGNDSSYLSDKQIADEVKELLGGMDEGSRNNTCFYLACYLHAKGFNRSEIDSMLIDYGNNCTPQLSEHEVLRTIESAMKGKA